jgi:paraquat-inducible protein B
MASAQDPGENTGSHVRQRISVIWLIPLVAALAAGWLGWQSLSERGPTITITFTSAEGLAAGKTKIEHNNVELGTIETIEPSSDFNRVITTARVSKVVEDHLTEGTRFWIVRPRFSAEGISGLSTLISGAYVELDPGQGPPTRHFTALEEPPVITANEPGVTYTLHATHLGSITQGAPIYYRGLNVGQVLGYELSDADGSVAVRIFIRAPHDQLVHEGTRFWNASGIAVTAGSEGLKVQSESLWTLLAGGIDFDVPAGGEAGAPAKPDASYTLYEDVAAANDATYLRKARFLLHFPQSVANLKPGAEVRMQGIRIGQVADVHMEFDEAMNLVTVPVVIEIEPDRVKLLHETATTGSFEEKADAILAHFVAHGLRAQLGVGNLLTGQKVVNLDFVAGAPNAAMDEGGVYPEIPTVPSDDLDSMISSAKDLLASLQITATQANAILASPEIARTLRSLDKSLDNLDSITADARKAGVGPLIAELRAAADSAELALKQANTTLTVATGALDSRPSDGGDLAGTLRELKTAARSVRVLADYLESHPESLLRGRSEAAKQ